MRKLSKEAAGNLHVDLELSRDFLISFSRFEYALKEKLYVHKGDAVKPLKVNYSKFGADIRDRFKEKMTGDPTLKKAVEYFCSEPPKEQIWDGEKPRWSEQETGVEATSDNMIQLIYRVRNNLFHGGKGWLHPEGNNERDKLLMEYALEILEAMLDCDEALKHEFSSYQ
ncbi:hypothetical protein [Cohaesibacter gelatinilyticus]|uniref:Apea-like HEPN domain-containing protein n=1 Tax=Cohaesibacter gelatinilyticus TaxID=372072 RepID=A0A285PJ61_9HYPH|nr:hypothetical protein [Cohaesibacter gelatinilyticus]SNZ21323.1 hypothetical protein SAMN06265368_4440 [Cohaesibacter gelatinilyticus]